MKKHTRVPAAMAAMVTLSGIERPPTPDAKRCKCGWKLPANIDIIAEPVPAKITTIIQCPGCGAELTSTRTLAQELARETDTLPAPPQDGEPS